MTQSSAGVRLRGHAGVVAAGAAIVVVGMVFSLTWGPVVRHLSTWVTPADLWGTVREAHVVAWGGEGILYQARATGFITLPGIAVLLAPVSMVSSALHLTESYPLMLNHPTAWLLFGPIEMALGSAVLFPFDTLARRLGVTRGRRVLLMWVEAAIVWPAVVLWGHPEDLVALTFALYGLMDAFDGRWTRSAALFAVAVAFQPLTLLVLPLAFAYVPARVWLRSAAIVALPSALLLIAPLVHAWATTTYALVDQPTYPTLLHATPWLALSPILQHASTSGAVSLEHTVAGGTVATMARPALETVAGGPSRLLAVAASIGIAVYVGRRRPTELTVVWLAALAFSTWCVFEAVLLPYYLVPGLALSLLAAAVGGGPRLLVAVGCAAVCTYCSYLYLGPWAYYLCVVGLLLATWCSGWPGAPRLAPARVPRVGTERETAACLVPSAGR